MRTHELTPTRRRHAVVAFISARAEAEKHFDGTVHGCAVCEDTWQALLSNGNAQDVSIKPKQPDEPPVFRGVPIEVVERGNPDVWLFRFMQREQTGAPPHSPAAAAKWKRGRG